MAAFTFNPAELDQTVEVMALQSSGTAYAWAPVRTIYAAAEAQQGKNLFSAVGIGVTSEKFMIRKQDLTLDNAFRWKGDHYFLTRIDEIRRLYYEVTAAKIEPRTCKAARAETAENELKNPVSAPAVVCTFPGCIVEKYMGFQQLKPMAETQTTYVLVTPKAVALRLADLVEIDGVPYNVQVLHTLDPYKNEYEIAREADI